MTWALFGLAFFGTTALAAPKKELWVYTSIYKEFAAPIEKAFEEKNPDIDVQVFQAGSEKIQAKVEAELVAKKPQADVILTSDPFWSMDLEKRGLAFARPGHSAVEPNYYSLMVLIAHKDFPQAQRPKSFQDLTRPEFKKLIQMGSPLESGTMFSAVAYLSSRYGWEFFEKLRQNQIASAGGNSSVIQKVESGEKKLGVVLLENALAAIKRGSPVEIIYPSDGGIAIPSVQVILKDAPNRDAAVKFAEFIVSKDGQQLLRNGFMYSTRKDVPAPEGAKSFAEATKSSTAFTPEFMKKTADSAKDIKRKFSEMILE